MASESNVVEIYVDRVTRQVLQYIPATGTLDSGEELPATAFFITQINLDTFDDSTPIMICPHTDECDYKIETCEHYGEHEYMDGCDEDCQANEFVGGCHTAEFTPVDDVGDEEEIS